MSNSVKLYPVDQYPTSGPWRTSVPTFPVLTSMAQAACFVCSGQLHLKVLAFPICGAFTATGLQAVTSLVLSLEALILLHDANQALTSLRENFSLGVSTEMTVAPSLMASLGLLHCKASLTLHSFSSFQNFTIQETHTQYPLWLPAWDSALAASGPQFVCGDPEETENLPQGQWSILNHH